MAYAELPAPERRHVAIPEHFDVALPAPATVAFALGPDPRFVCIVAVPALRRSRLTTAAPAMKRFQLIEQQHADRRVVMHLYAFHGAVAGALPPCIGLMCMPPVAP
jgi:hypothetical protein